MPMSDRLQDIIQRIASGEYSETDIAALRQALDRKHAELQLSKYNINISEGRNIQIGDRTYVSWSDEAIQALLQAIRADQSGNQ